MELVTTLPLVSWGNGILIIGVFALVVILIIAVVVNMMKSGQKKE
ncbi:hypothetical protein [Muriicola sp.]